MSEPLVIPSKTLATFTRATSVRAVKPDGIGVMDLRMTEHIRVAGKDSTTARVWAPKTGHGGWKNLVLR